MKESDAHSSPIKSPRQLIIVVVLAFVKLIPWEANIPNAEVGWFFTHKAMSSACIPSILITSTRRIL